jgi:hypothetical protein
MTNQCKFAILAFELAVGFHKTKQETEIERVVVKIGDVAAFTFRATVAWQIPSADIPTERSEFARGMIVTLGVLSDPVSYDQSPARGHGFWSDPSLIKQLEATMAFELSFFSYYLIMFCGHASRFSFRNAKPVKRHCREVADRIPLKGMINDPVVEHIRRYNYASRTCVFSRVGFRAGSCVVARSTSRAAAFVVFFALVIFCQRSQAQSGENTGSDFSLFAGYMLPNGIDGVTEIMSVFGGRYSFSLPVGSVELEGTNTHSEGVDFTTFGASLRGEIPVAHGLSGLIYGGPDIHWYIPRGDTERHTDYGIHVGGAGLLLVTDSLWLRGDLKFMGNPGTALYLLFGLMFRPSGI